MTFKPSTTSCERTIIQGSANWEVHKNILVYFWQLPLSELIYHNAGSFVAYTHNIIFSRDDNMWSSHISCCQNALLKSTMRRSCAVAWIPLQTQQSWLPSFSSHLYGTPLWRTQGCCLFCTTWGFVSITAGREQSPMRHHLTQWGETFIAVRRAQWNPMTKLFCSICREQSVHFPILPLSAWCNHVSRQILTKCWLKILVSQ